MKYGRYGWSYRWLTWGLGATFLWIGLNILMEPNAWIGYVPAGLPFGLTRETALQINGVLDALIGVAFFMHWWPRMTAWLASFHLLGILVTQGIDAVIIRDVGLLGATLAMAFWPHGYRKKRGWQFWRRKHISLED